MKMKQLITMLCLGLLSFAIHAQAKIEFKTDTIDYGTIEKGSNGVRK